MLFVSKAAVKLHNARIVDEGKHFYTANKMIGEVMLFNFLFIEFLYSDDEICLDVSKLSDGVPR